MVLAVSLGVALGQWQTRRGDFKEAIEHQLQLRESEPPLSIGAKLLSVEAAEYRRVNMRGEFIRTWPIYLDNRPLQGKAGFYLLMPLKIAGTDMHVLVMRGWLPRDPKDRTAIPEFTTPSGLVDVEGVARKGPGQLLELGAAVPLRPNAIVQNVDARQFAAASQLTMQPFVIEQANDSGDGLLREWPRPSSGIDKHRGYAFQWYALAATAFLFFIATGFRRGPK